MMQLVRKYFIHGLIASILLGALFAFLGVYDTNAQPYFRRFVFWTSTMVVGIFSTGLSIPWVFSRWLPNNHLAIQLLTVTILISFPVTLVLAAFDHNLGADWSAYIWLIQYRYVIVISAIVIFGGYFALNAQGLIENKKSVDISPNQAPSIEKYSPESNFLKRLSLPFQQAELYAIASEDHYVRVYTDKGAELVLMRLSDALHALEHAKGMQTHRSWWVAKEAVVDIRSKQGKTTLLVKSGLSVPVSRSFDKAVKDVLINANQPP